MLAFHVLSEIHTKNITNEEDVRTWYSRSLAAVQQIDMHEDDVNQVIKDLLNMRMIKKLKNSSALSTTSMGMVSALLYYSPYDIYEWYRNFEQLKTKGRINDSMIAWALADIPSNRLDYIPKTLIEKASEFKTILSNNGVITSDLYSISTMIAAYHCMQGTEPLDGAIKSIMRSFQYDASRMITALKMLDAKYSKWDMDWEDIGARAIYGVRKEMVDLVRIEGVGKSRAEKLYNLGFTKVSTVAQLDVSKLQPAFTLKLAKDIIKNAQKINRL